MSQIIGIEDGRERRHGRGRGGRTDGERNIKWCEDHLFVPEGRFVGKPLKLAPYMKADFRHIYDNPDRTRRAIISRGRKNAKSTECAMITLLHLCGPEHRVNSQLFSCAQSRDQAGVLFTLAAKMVRMSPTLRSFVTIKETAKELVCPELGTMYKALSADATTAFGLSPVLTIFDELGQVKGPRDALFEAMETATAAQDNPMSVIISTQAPTDGDLMSILIDDAMAGHDPSVVLRFDTSPEDIDPFSLESIKLANPAFDHFMNQKEVLAMAENARRMPAREAQYRNLVLNQRVEASSPFITQAQWKQCGAEPRSLEGKTVFGGLDLSETADLTALALVSVDPVDAKWDVEMTFWLPGEKLKDKALVDRVPYDMWEDQGYLETTPGPSISYEYVAQYLKRVFETRKVVKMAFDRWNMAHLKPWLLEAGFTETMIKNIFVDFGQGFKSMSPALRDLESLILEKKLRHGNQPVLAMCMNNAVIERDPAGNRKLSKKRSSGRIDGAVALAMAIASAPLRPTKIDIAALIG